MQLDWVSRRLAIAILYAGAMSAGASRPDFTGTWKLNLSKSDLGPMPPPSAMTLAIIQKDPELKVTTKISGGPQGDLDYDAKYTTDGKESINRLAGRDARSKANWEGDTLTIDTKADFGGVDVDILSRWNLSEGGKVLKQTAHVTTAQGNFDPSYVFEKQ